MAHASAVLMNSTLKKHRRCCMAHSRCTLSPKPTSPPVANDDKLAWPGACRSGPPFTCQPVPGKWTQEPGQICRAGSPPDMGFLDLPFIQPYHILPQLRYAITIIEDEAFIGNAHVYGTADTFHSSKLWSMRCCQRTTGSGAEETHSRLS